MLSFFALISSANYWKLIYDSIFITISTVVWYFSFMCSTFVMLKYNDRVNLSKFISVSLSTNLSCLLLIAVFYFIPIF
jgi:hypothetical protein